jgi:elongation factor Ts
MTTITTEMIKELREKTNAGILDCRKALQDADGDMKQALDNLREKGLATALQRSSRTASEGVLDIYSHGNGRVGVMVEVNSETDFVGRSDQFRHFAHELALQIAASAPQYVNEAEIPEEVLEHERQIAAAKAREDGKPESILPKIVEGSIKKFMDEAVLLRQPYIRDEKITIQELLNQNIASLGENVIIRRFVRWQLGEESE